MSDARLRRLEEKLALPARTVVTLENTDGTIPADALARAAEARRAGCPVELIVVANPYGRGES